MTIVVRGDRRRTTGAALRRPVFWSVSAFAVLVACSASDGTPAADTSPPSPGPSVEASGTLLPSGEPAAPTGGETGPAETTVAPGSGGGRPPRCATSGLVVSVASPDGLAGAGHQGFVLVFTNDTDAACALTGYPGLSARDPGGRDVDAARTENGYIFRNISVETVTLAPRGTASAGVEWTVVPSGDQPGCVDYSGLTVTPPDETHSVPVYRELSFCGGFEIHPVVPGANGGLAD